MLILNCHIRNMLHCCQPFFFSLLFAFAKYTYLTHNQLMHPFSLIFGEKKNTDIHLILSSQEISNSFENTCKLFVKKTILCVCEVT